MKVSQIRAATLVATLEIDGTECRDGNDMLAGFVGDECRSVTRPMYVEGIDRYVARIHSTVKKSSFYFAEKAVPQPLSLILGRALRWPCGG